MNTWKAIGFHNTALIFKTRCRTCLPAGSPVRDLQRCTCSGPGRRSGALCLPIPTRMAWLPAKSVTCLLKQHREYGVGWHVGVQMLAAGVAGASARGGRPGAARCQPQPAPPQGSGEPISQEGGASVKIYPRKGRKCWRERGGGKKRRKKQHREHQGERRRRTKRRNIWRSSYSCCMP